MVGFESSVGTGLNPVLSTAVSSSPRRGTPSLRPWRSPFDQTLGDASPLPLERNGRSGRTVAVEGGRSSCVPACAEAAGRSVTEP